MIGVRERGVTMELTITQCNPRGRGTVPHAEGEREMEREEEREIKREF